MKSGEANVSKANVMTRPNEAHRGGAAAIAG